MSERELQTLREKASFIVASYAFIEREDGQISIVNLESPFHASVIDYEGNVLETNMHDIELAIVIGHYWKKNRNFLSDPRYA